MKTGLIHGRSWQIVTLDTILPRKGQLLGDGGWLYILFQNRSIEDGKDFRYYYYFVLGDFRWCPHLCGRLMWIYKGLKHEEI